MPTLPEVSSPSLAVTCPRSRSSRRARVSGDGSTHVRPPGACGHLVPSPLGRSGSGGIHGDARWVSPMHSSTAPEHGAPYVDPAGQVGNPAGQVREGVRKVPCGAMFCHGRCGRCGRCCGAGITIPRALVMVLESFILPRPCSRASSGLMHPGVSGNVPRVLLAASGTILDEAAGAVCHDAAGEACACNVHQSLLGFQPQ